MLRTGETYMSQFQVKTLVSDDGFLDLARLVNAGEIRLGFKLVERRIEIYRDGELVGYCDFFANEVKRPCYRDPEFEFSFNYEGHTIHVPRLSDIVEAFEGLPITITRERMLTRPGYRVYVKLNKYVDKDTFNRYVSTAKLLGMKYDAGLKAWYIER
jgi:hypothetical protein